MIEKQSCSRCGAELPGGTWNHFCPKCLARVSLVPELSADPSPNGDSAGEAAEPLLPSSTRRRIADYELLEEIAQGGTAVVWRARQISVDREVALKLLRAAEFVRPADRERFRAEAAAVASLQHGNIVRLHDFGEHEGQPWTSMDFVGDSTLAQVIREQPLSPKRAAELLKTIAEAIAYAHSHGILHRDLKPSNILLDARGHPRITDFGLAKRFGVPAPNGHDERKDADATRSAASISHDLTISGQFLGTPHYAPPEQLSIHRGEVGPHSDVYALGAVLYEMLTGRPPFSAESIEATLLQVIDAEPISPCSLNAVVPTDLETICLKCLEKEPARRYATPQELADELGRYLRGEPIVARPLGFAEQFARWCRRKPGWATAGALGLILTVTICVFVTHMTKKNGDATALSSQSSAATAVPVRLQNATATFSQTFEAPWLVSSAIDGNLSTGGWAIYGLSESTDQTHQQTAVFETASDIGFATGSLLTFRLLQHGGNQQTLGRFRLSVTTDERGSFADALPTEGDVTAKWFVLDPNSLSSANGSTLTKLPDSSILSTGAAPETDTYTISAPTRLTGITGVRIETLADHTLPFNGPGRGPASGNFVLTELELTISPASDPDFTNLLSSMLQSEGAATLVAAFRDEHFHASDWLMFSFFEPHHVRVTQAQIRDDSSGAFGRITHILGGTATPSVALSFHLNTTAVYSPVKQGAIEYIDYAEDARTFATESNSYGGSSTLALQQNGHIYVARWAFQPVRDDHTSKQLPSRWKEIRQSGLRQSDFFMVTDPMMSDRSRNPDFSSNGTPITFGFARWNTHMHALITSRQSDIDNWSVSLYSRPK